MSALARAQTSAGEKATATRHRSAVELLAGHFFRRFFDNDTIQVEGDTQTTVARAIAIVATPGLMIAFFLQNAYPARTFWYRIEDHYTFILITYVVMGIAAVLEWEMLFPDTLDFLVLTPLPLRRGGMLAGKAAALLLFLLLFLVGSSALGDFVLPAVSKAGFRLQMPAQVLAVSLAGVFAAVSFLAFAGLLLCVLGTARFRAVSPVMQALAIASFVLLGIHFLEYGASLPAMLTGSLRVARWVPPLWFLGLYEKAYHGSAAPPFAEELARRAVWGTVWASVTAVVTYPLAWMRMHRFAIEGAPRRQAAPSERWHGWMGAMLPRQGERAVFHFIGQTIARNSRYQVYLAVYCGAALALAVACGVVIRSGPAGLRVSMSLWGMHAVLPLLVFWTIAGLRVAFGIPANLGAGWVFKVTGVDLAECASAARKWAVLCASGILAAVLVLLAALGWGWQQLGVQLVCGSALAILFADVFFASETRVPFNSPRMPGRVSFPLMLTLYIGVLPLFLQGMMHAEVALETRPVRLALVAFAAAGIHLVLVRLSEG
jgi:hypothetical protein